MKKYILRVTALSLAMILLLTSSGFALTLRYPKSGDDVAALQAALKQLGFYSKTIDGEYGTGTRTAVRQFQQAHGLTVDGVAGPGTLSKLEALTGIRIGGATSSDDAASGENGSTSEQTLFGGDYATIQFGQTGERVRILQRALQALGFEVNVDGEFGSTTYLAVQDFQQNQGLTVDGKAGKSTLRKLESYFDEDGNLFSGPIIRPSMDWGSADYDVPARTLRYGMSGEDVRFTQQRLYTLAYYSGERDGQFGSSMLSAVKAFQKKNDLTADGVIGTDTRKVLFSTSAIAADEETPAVTQRTLRYGMEGEDVAAMQLRLKELGYYTRTADGIFGSGTRTALKQFQARNGLTADGVCGKKTYEILHSDDAIGAEDETDQEVNPPALVQTLEYGDRGEAVKTLQRRLRELGYYSSTIDGIFGSGTYSAVKRFQTRNGLTVDGKAGKNTLARLYSEAAIAAEDETPEEVTPTPTLTPTPTPTPAATPSRTLRYGMSGEDVRLLQNRLIELGYLKITANGSFDSSTLAAVKAFQAANGLTVDGIAGTNTYKKLFSDSAVEATPVPDTGDTSIIPERTLTVGDTGEDVKSVQQRLKDLKYLSAAADGVFGSATASALRAFQQMNSLTVTGQGNMATYARLYSDDALNALGVHEGEKAPSYTSLKSGATGPAVTRLQQALVSYDYSLSVTGTYDDATLQAVRSFQALNGLSVDGVAGKNTQSLLYSGNCKRFPTGPSGSIYGSMGYVAAPAKSQIQLLHWADELKDTLAYHDVLLVYDPATGISWSLTIIARGRHCDVEPTAKADTAAMHAAFGHVVTWTPKPVYVRLPDGRWTVATTHNVAHGINPIKDNDFEGQNCVHFLRDMSETEDKDPNYGVTNQKALRKFWLELTGESIPYK